jgi:hypothetical protein
MNAVDLLKKADELAENRRLNNPLLMSRNHYSEIQSNIIVLVAEQLQKKADEVMWFPISSEELFKTTQGVEMSIGELNSLMQRGGFFGARETKEGFEFGITKRRLWELQEAGLGTVKIDKPE